MSIYNPVSTRVITGEDTRFSYPNVFEPRSINGGEPQYDICLLIPKTDTATVNAIRASMEAAYRSGTGTLQGKGPVPPLEAIRLPRAYMDSTVRISLSVMNTEEDIRQASSALHEVIPFLRKYTRR